MKLDETPKVVPAILYTQGSTKVNDEVTKELNIPDPDGEIAVAIIKQNTDEKAKR